MGLEIAQQIALSGLTATQAQIQVIAGNIANVQTPGYSNESMAQVSVVEPNGGSGVATLAVQRATDKTLQNNLLAQTTTATNATTLNTYYQQIQNIFGQVGTGATINNALNTFDTAMQTVATTPTDPVAQGAAVNAGQTLAQALNQLSAGIQTIRQSTDSDLATAINSLNTALGTIATLNGQISNLAADGQSTAILQDQRDEALTQVSQLVGVNNYIAANGEMTVFTTTGQTVVDGSGAKPITYTPSGNVSAGATLSAITLNGVDISSDINTGQIGALLALRNTDLPNLTAQLNQFTNNLFASTAVPQSTLTMDGAAGPLAAGDTYTATVDGQTYSTLPLPSGPTMNNVVTALNAVLGGATIAVGGGAPQAGDSFAATVNGTPFTTSALPAGGTYTTSDIVNSLNATFSAINVPVTLGTPVTGDTFTATVNGTAYTSAALSGGGYTVGSIAAALNATLNGITVPLGGVPAATDKYDVTVNGTTYTTAAIGGTTVAAAATAINAVLPAGVTATANGGSIVFTDSAGVLSSTTIAAHGAVTGSAVLPASGTPATTYTATASGNNIVIQDTAGVLSSATIANGGGNTGTEIFAGTTMTVPAYVNTPVAGDKFNTTVNGTTYVSTALTGTGPFTLANVVSAINATLPASLSATITNGQIVITASSGTISSLSIANNPSNAGTMSFGVAGQASSYFAQQSGSNIVIGNVTGAPVTASMALAGGSTGTETFAAPTYTTISASTNAGNVILTDTSGNPITSAITANPLLTAGTPNNSGTPTTIDFTQTSGSINPAQVFNVTVDGTTYGPTTALGAGATSLSSVAAAIQANFTAAAVNFTATVVAGKLRISDPAGNPITASVTLATGPGSETFTADVATSPLNTTKSGLGVTDDANHFFSDVNIASGLDNASTIQVNPSLLANTALLSTGGTGADPSISQNLAAGLGKNYTFAAAGGFTNSITTTLGNYSAQMIGQVAANASTVTANSTYQTSLQTQLTTQASTVSGVNLDEELANLVSYQNAYGASAHVMTTIQALFDTLMHF